MKSKKNLIQQHTFHLAIAITASLQINTKEIRILDQFEDVADEGAASHVAAGDLIDRNFLFCAGNCIQFGYEADITLEDKDVSLNCQMRSIG